MWANLGWALLAGLVMMTLPAIGRTEARKQAQPVPIYKSQVDELRQPAADTKKAGKRKARAPRRYQT